MTHPCWNAFCITKQNLLDDVYQKFLVRQMNMENPTPVEEHYKTSYRMHMPLESEDFYQKLLEKILHCHHVDECCDVEESMLIYIKANLYNTVGSHSYSLSARVVAANVYFELITFNCVFLDNANIASSCTFLCRMFERNYSNIPIEKIKNCINSMIAYTEFNEVPDDYLRCLTVCLVKIALIATGEVLPVDLCSDPSIGVFAFNRLKQMIFRPKRMYNTCVIYSALLTSYTRFSSYEFVSPQTIEYGQYNIVLFLRVIMNEQGETEKNKMLMAFLEEISQDNFFAFNKFVYVLSVFDEDRIRTFVKKLGESMLMKRSERRLPRLLKMTGALIHVFNTETVAEKYIVLLQILLINIIKLIRHPRLNKLIIEQLHAMCTKSNRLFNTLCKTVPSNFVAGENLLNGLAVSFLRYFEHSNHVRVKMMLTIYLHFMAHRTREIHDEDVCSDVIYKLALKCSPHTFKPMLPVFHEKLYTFIEYEKEVVANTMIKVLFKFALSNTPTSMEYLKHFYKCLTKSSEIQNLSLPIGFYGVALLQTDKIKILMGHFRDKHLIKRDDIDHLFTTVRHRSPADIAILCHFIEYSNDRFIPKFVDFILRLTPDVIASDHMSVMYDTMKNLLEKRNQQLSPSNLQQLDIVYSNLAEQLLAQSVHLRAFDAAFALWVKLAEVLKVSYEGTLEKLKQTYMVMLQRSLTNSSKTFIPICYADKLIMATNAKLERPIANIAYDKLVNVMRMDPNKRTKWVPILTLFIHCALKNSSLRENAIQVCKLAAMNASDPGIREGVVMAYFNFCTLSVKNFTDFNHILFTLLELKNDDPLVVLYLKIADELIENGNLLVQGIHFFKMVAPLTSSQYYNETKIALRNSYIMKDTNSVAKHFILLLFYINIFKDHPLYPLGDDFKPFLPYNKTIPLDRHSMYTVVFKSLPVKKRFQILMELRNIFHDMLANNYNLRTAIALMNDVIAIFEIMVTSGLESPNVDNKHVRLIWQELVRDGTKVPKAIKDVKGASFPGERDQIKILTVELLSLYSSKHLHDTLKKRLFKTIIHWTMYFIKDLSNEIYSQRNKSLLNLYKSINPNVYLTTEID